MNPIERVVKGERPTLLEAHKANELIDAINALINISIEEAEDNEDPSVIISDRNTIIKIKKGGGNIDANTLQAYVCVNGVAELKLFMLFDGKDKRIYLIPLQMHLLLCSCNSL